MAIPARYSDLDFTPNDGMIAEADRGLAWRREFGRGGTEVGIARARDIANNRTLSPDTVKRMRSYFARHEVDKEAQGFRSGEDGYPSNGRIAWALWGGDAGKSWANTLVERMNRIDEMDKTTKQADYSIGTPTDLQTGVLSDVGLSSWERGEVIPRVFDWARNDDGDIEPSRAKRAFLIVNNDELDVQSGYSFPVAVPNSNGVLIVTREGINAANSRLGALINNPENTDIPLDVLQRARVRLKNYREEFQEDKGMSITDTPKTKDLAEAITIGDYREEGTPDKNCLNCFHNTDGFCDKFDFVHGGADFVSDAWLPVNEEASAHMEEEREEDKAESKHQSKISLIKNIVLDWVDSVFHKQTIEIKLDIDDLVEKEEEKTIITPDVDDSPTESAMKIFKNKSGRYVFIGRYSNNFRDNDIIPEIITRDAHKDFIKRVTDGDAELPELWIMHNPLWKVGHCTHLRWDENSKGQGFAMCFGLFDEDKHYIAEALANSNKSQAMSHGYGKHLDDLEYDELDSTLITKLTSHEVTIAYPDIAANKLTTFNSIGANSKMAIENKEEIEEKLGLNDGHLDTLEGQNGKGLDAIGDQIPSKTLAETKQETETKTETSNEMIETVSLLLENQKQLSEQMATLMTAIDQQNKTIEALQKPIDEKVAKIANEASPATLKAILAEARGLVNGNSVVGDNSVKLDARTREYKDEPKVKEVKPNASKKLHSHRDDIGFGDDFS